MSELKQIPPIPFLDIENKMKHSDVQSTYKKPSNFEIFNACVNNLTGKDKLAKTTQYVLRFLASINDTHGLGNPEIAKTVCSEFALNKVTYDKNINNSIEHNNDSINNSLNTSKFKIGYILNKLSKNTNLLSAAKLNRLFLIILAFITKKLSGLLNGLNIYRHVLRAGTLPFRFWKFSNHIKFSIKTLTDCKTIESPAVRLEKVLSYWSTKDMISQMANFWYALSDEILLLFRFNILLKGNKGNRFTNALFLWAEDHELYSWMATIILGLYNDWNKFLLYKDKESKIILTQKVKSRTRKIVTDLHRKNCAKRGDTPDFQVAEQEDNLQYTKELEEINTELTRIKINFIRLSCDLVFDAKYILGFNMYRPLHVSLGLVSGVLGLCNVWRQQRDRLHEEAREQHLIKFETQVEPDDDVDE